jgi:two-component system chemotaxis response regulator CheB
MIAAGRVIRVLIVDDSAFMRRAIEKMLVSEPDISVVGVASTGEEGLEKQAELKPDIITMDVEMPGIGGLEAARQIIARRGPPIIMISSLTREGADTTLRALEIGVVDFIPKPNSAYIDILRVKSDLVEKVRYFGSRAAVMSRPPVPSARTASTVPAPVAAPPAVTQVATVAPSPARPSFVARAARARSGSFECVAIGTSTGGPVALATVLPKLPKAFPLPIVVVQHMPPGFTKALADRLNATSQIRVVEGENGMRLAPGTAIIAPAGQQLTLRRVGAAIEIRLDADVKKSLHVPSVDVMAGSVGEVFGAAALGVILTGMGHDGVIGLGVIKRNGGYVIGQDEASAVVYGMPRAAAVAGLVDRVSPLDNVARAICEAVGTPYVSNP